MDTTIHSASATSSEVGYSLDQQPFSLAASWLGYCKHPDDPVHLRVFTEQLDLAIKNALCDGKYFGVLQGRESEVRQGAFLLLLDRYLANNRNLVGATIAEDLRTMETLLGSSIDAALWAIRSKLLRQLQKEKERYQYLENMDDESVGGCLHPAERRSFWELPYEAKRALVILSLQQAVANKVLPSKCAATAIQMVEEEINQSQAAKKMGISRQAVHQQLQSVRKPLINIINTQEFPLCQK